MVLTIDFHGITKRCTPLGLPMVSLTCLSQLIDFPTLESGARNRLDQDSSLEEAQEVLGHLQSSKALGIDGITIEFCSLYQELLVPRFTSLLAQFTSLSSLPESMSEALIVLVPRPGKDIENCASYRPISLINMDAKILAKIWVPRLSRVILFMLIRLVLCLRRARTLISNTFSSTLLRPMPTVA